MQREFDEPPSKFQVRDEVLIDWRSPFLVKEFSQKMSIVSCRGGRSLLPQDMTYMRAEERRC